MGAFVAKAVERSVQQSLGLMKEGERFACLGQALQEEHRALLENYTGIVAQKTMHWLLFLLSESEDIHMMIDTRLGEVNLGKVKSYRQLHEWLHSDSKTN
ncbi:hypothetical protein ACFQ5B_13155 [Laceyella putida]|uniref:Uncharacterized protein n=2 Tax=Laceyella putida TaxID=110101 RepID=A0ABW2RN41_9BACL